MQFVKKMKTAAQLFTLIRWWHGWQCFRSCMQLQDTGWLVGNSHVADLEHQTLDIAFVADICSDKHTAGVGYACTHASTVMVCKHQSVGVSVGKGQSGHTTATHQTAFKVYVSNML
jgi:hypothetical protein